MAIDVEADGSAGQLFARLAQELHDRRTGRRGRLLWSRERTEMKGLRPPLELLWDYFSGEPPLSAIHRGFEEHMRRIIRTGRLNIAGLLVTSPGSRLSLRGFHTAETNDEAGDAKVLEMMTETGLQLVSRDAHDFALAMADGYVLVSPPNDGDPWATPTAEDPRQVITAHDPATGAPRGGLKMYRDDWDEADIAWVYLPTSDGACEIHKLVRKGRRSCITDGPFRLDPDAWNVDESAGDHADRFPIIRMRNKHGVGEFEEHLDSLDRINDKIFNEWWIGKLQAFRQMAIKNLPDADEDGKPIDWGDVFSLDPGAAWQVPEGVDFWQSQPTDMTGIIQSIQKDLERLAAVTSQPLHTITPDAAAGSAEGASLMREEHIYKIEDRRDRFSRPWADVMGLLMEFSPEIERRKGIVPIWGPLQRYSLQEKSNAASQVARVLPPEAIWTDVLQYDPADLPRLRAQTGRALLFQLPAAGGQQQPPPADQPAA